MVGKRGKLEVLKRYHFMKEIGSGGFSRVYKATAHNDTKPVAIKVVRIPEDNEELRGIMENEVKIMEYVTAEIPELSHNFVQFYEVINDFEQMSIVMEFLEGGELFDRIVQQTKYSENDASKLMRKMLVALDGLHKRGIVHRDLKPENLVYATQDKDSDIKIMDFGLSWFVGERDIPSEGTKYIGTPGYISPEAISKKQYGPEGDIWSMGVILFILLSGRMPFGGHNEYAMNAKILAGKVKMTGGAWDRISKSAKDLIKKMLTLDPEKRITIDGILRHKWMTTDHQPFNLGVTLIKLADFNERRKIENEVKKMLNQTTDKVQKQLVTLIGETTEKSLGLTLDDILRVRNAFMNANGKAVPPTEVQISRENFVQIMTKLGFSKLPLDEMFDALLNQTYERDMIQEDIKRRGPSMIEEEMFMDEGNERTIQLDEVLVGLSTVVAVESTEKLLSFLYETFSNAEKEQGGLSARGLAKILRVFASYERPKDRSRVDEISSHIMLLFSKSERADENDPEGGKKGISYEEFKQGMSNFGEDVFKGFFVEPIKKIGHKLGQYAPSWVNNENVGKTVQYLTKIGSYANDIGGRWNPIEHVDTKRTKMDDDEGGEKS